MTLGAILSIQSTVAVADQVLPARSTNVKVNNPLPVKRYPVAFHQVISSETQVNKAITLPEVRDQDQGK